MLLLLLLINVWPYGARHPPDAYLETKDLGRAFLLCSLYLSQTKPRSEEGQAKKPPEN